MTWFKKAPKQPRKRAICAVHGDLSSPEEQGGIRFHPHMTDSQWICPKCFAAWLLKNFPVEIREDDRS